jgi:hypothetical protein
MLRKSEFDTTIDHTHTVLLQHSLVNSSLMADVGLGIITTLSNETHSIRRISRENAGMIP